MSVLRNKEGPAMALGAVVGHCCLYTVVHGHNEL